MFALSPGHLAVQHHAAACLCCPHSPGRERHRETHSALLGLGAERTPRAIDAAGSIMSQNKPAPDVDEALDANSQIEEPEHLCPLCLTNAGA